MLFATCSFPEYRPEMGGIPVRAANGKPRYPLRYPLVYALPQTFPDWKIVKANLGWDDFARRYRARLDGIGVDSIRQQAENVRADAVRNQMPGVTAESPLVLLCFENMGAKPDNWCHRTAFASWWSQMTGEEVPEFGSRPQAEIRSQDPLF